MTTTSNRTSRFYRMLGSMLLPAFFLALAPLSTQAAFKFEKGDRICYIGNALADRMQHDGWVETLIQSKTRDLNLVFRNMGFAGDMIKDRPRSKGFMSPEQYLEHCKADVIFVFFGYNESYKGDGGLAGFEKNLSTMIDGYSAKKFNGKSAPRFVLFSPIAHEDHKDPNLTDGKANNQRLVKYTAAIERVAESKNAMFVDLFNPTKALYAKASKPLTINGVHMSKEGNRQLAEVIARALLDQPVVASAGLESLRQAVLDKNVHWYNRYRATDGNDTWGGRSGLKFVDGQTNRVVLQHELGMFDIMTANRDPKIWAVAKGNDHKVDDSNVPAPIPVVSNVGGGSKSSNKQKEGNVNYISGQEGISKMKIAEGFEVNLFADEKMFPELVNPVQMAVDPKGRLWVAAWKTYPKWEPLKEMDDRLLILPDENRDGVADKAITFAKVHNPTGFEFWNGGVLVASAPDIIFLKDTDGDDVADVRIHMLQGIDSADTHHTMNAFVYGPDGGLYYQRGVFHVSNVETPWAPPQKSGASAMYRFDPRRHTFNFHASNSPNPHGISFDRWGYHYATDGTGGRAYQVHPSGKGFKMRKLLNKQVRPVPANGVISSTHFPEDRQQNFMILNSIGFLGIKEYNLERNAETGVVWGEPVGDLVVSSDKNFRPTDVEFGDDGALYFSDWSNVIIGHMQHNVRDPNRDHKHGRVYRMTAKGRPLQESVLVAGQPISALLDNLKHPTDGVRYRTRIELSGRDSKEVIAATKNWIKQFDAKKKEHAHHLLEALWIHQQHNVNNPELLTALLNSPEPQARRAAQTVQHYIYNVDFTRGGAEMIEAEPMEVIKPEIIVKDGSVAVHIATVVEKMKYNMTSFDVKVGDKVTVKFSNPDFMPHNFVVTQPKAADEVAAEAIKLGAEGPEKGWLPDHPKIIISTKMLNKGEHQIIKFDAPDKPGNYEFVCTFPGHNLLMRGIMKVTK